MRSYRGLPSIPDAGPFERYRDTIGVIVPVARTNLVRNPSLETNTTDWAASGGSIARSTAEQYHGAYSLAVTPTAGTTDGVFSGLYSLTSGITYAVSVKIKGIAGVPYRLALLDNAVTTVLVSRSFRGTGFWQWIWLFYTEVSTTTRYVVIGKNTSTSTGVFYVDGLQIEACGAEGVFVTTYIDGDQRGLVANQYPPAYLWSGTPHASISSRSGQTRAGGRVLSLKQFGFLLTTIIGLGLSPTRQEALAFAQLDGAQYQDTIKTPRTFSLAGRFDADSPTAHDTGVGQLARLLDRDRVALRQPLVLTAQAQDCGAACGEPWRVAGVYTGGLEGVAAELPTSAAAMTFDSYLPLVQGRDGGAALTVQATVTNANGVIGRSPGGVWSALSTGLSGGSAAAYAIVEGNNGLIYVGGAFTDAGGSGADYIAAYNPATDTFSVVGSTTALNARVEALAAGPDNKIYVGGAFTNAGGVANADYLAVWDPAAGTWDSVGGVAGANDVVNAITVSPANVIYVGGAFTTIAGGAAAGVAYYDAGTWFSMGSGIPAFTTVYAMQAAPDGTVYAGGTFTSMGGVANTAYIARWTGSAWTSVGIFSATVRALAAGLDGTVYAGGEFTTINSISIARIASRNGQQWSPLGVGVNDVVYALTVAADGSLYAGGNFTTAGGLSLADRVARWNGVTWLALDANFPGTPIVGDIAATRAGGLYFGITTTGSAVAGAVTTVSNGGTAATAPTLVLRGPTSAITPRIYQIVNTTTGQAIYFNLTIAQGETITMTFTPTNVTLVSNARGNLLRTILPGSTPATFTLQPGTNTISLYVDDSTVTAALQWPYCYASINDTLYQVSE